MRCDECSAVLSDRSEIVYLPDLGYFHRDCLERCPDGIDWPRSLVASGDVRSVCSGCAEEGAA